MVFIVEIKPIIPIHEKNITVRNVLFYEPTANVGISKIWLNLLFLYLCRFPAVADPEGVRGVQTNPRLSLNYFIFMGNFRKN